MAQIADQGVSVDLPPGWEAEFIRRAPDPAPLGTTTPEETYAVLHIANWPMPTERGDFGSGAVEVMRSGDVLVILAEYGPENLGTALFKRVGVPWPLDAADFDKNRLQRPLPGQGGLQQFFAESDRAFCLYVVLGNLADADQLVGTVNALLETVAIT